MTQEQYDLKLKDINNSFEEAKKNLYIEYAKSQRKYKIGDIITDGSVILLIEKFGTNKTFGMPQPTYIGKLLKKDLTPRKSGDSECIYGNHNVELIKAL